MIKELYYELTLLTAKILGGRTESRGFFDNKKIYKKKGWLDWDVKKLDDGGNDGRK